MNAGTSDKYIVFGAPRIEDAEIDEVVDSLRSGWLGTGPKVAKFESDWLSCEQGYDKSLHFDVVRESCS